MTTKKRIYGLILCAAAALCLAFAIVFAACGDSEADEDIVGGSEETEVVDSGTSADTPEEDPYALKYYLNDSGDGYAVSGSSTKHTDVTIPSRYSGLPVTEIASEAFSGCTKLTSLVIPDSVTTIGDRAFYDCKALTEISLPDSVTTIGEYAFCGCSSVASLTVPASVTAMGDRAFCNMYALTDIYYDAATVGDFRPRANVFTCAGRDSDGITVTIGESVERIPSYLFYGFADSDDDVRADIVTVVFEDISHCASIGYSAFRLINTLSGVYIDDLAAWCTTDFENVGGANPLFNGGYLYVNGEPVTDLVIPSEVTSVSACAFGYYKPLKSVTIPDGVTSIGNCAFCGCRNLTSVTIPSGVTYIGSWVFAYCRSLTSVEIPDGVTVIESFTFYDCDSLASVNIPDGVTTIYMDAFSFCTSLTSIVIPSSVTVIGEDAFYYCKALTKVDITDLSAWCEITFYGKYANPLYYAKNLYLTGTPVTDLSVPTDVTEIGPYAFCCCTSLTSVTIGADVTKIGEGAFYGCSLTSVCIGDLSAWCDISFVDGLANPLHDAANLYLNSELVTALTIPDGTAKISDYAFYGCTAITSVTTGSYVTEIGENAFYGCTAITSVTTGSDMAEIGERAFYGCTGLKTVTVSGSVTKMGEDAFHGCTLTSVYIEDLSAWCAISFDGFTANPLHCATNLYLGDQKVTALEVPEGVTKIGDFAFYGFTALTSVTIGSDVAEIGAYAFWGCTKLESVTIPVSVTTIGDHAFYGCEKLAEVYFAGSGDDWDSIDISGTGNNPLTEAEIHYDDSDDSDE